MFENIKKVLVENEIESSIYELEQMYVEELNKIRLKLIDKVTEHLTDYEYEESEKCIMNLKEIDRMTDSEEETEEYINYNGVDYPIKLKTKEGNRFTEAKAELFQNKALLVKKGSKAIKEFDRISAKNKESRDSLINEGILKDDGKWYILTKDYEFKSINIATEILLGRGNRQYNWVEEETEEVWDTYIKNRQRR